MGSRRNALAGRYDDCVLPGLYRRSPLFGGIITSDRSREGEQTDGWTDSSKTLLLATRGLRGGGRLDLRGTKARGSKVAIGWGSEVLLFP